MKAARSAAWVSAVTAALSLLPAGPLSGQLEDPLSAQGDGVVRMTYATRPGVRVCTSGIHRRDASSGTSAWRDGTERLCRERTVEIEATMSGGRVRALNLLRLEETANGSVRDLGRVPVEDAAAFLLSVAREGEPGVAEEAIHAVVLADSVEVWPALLELARDRERPGRVRKSALFWLGQEAAASVTADLVAAAADEGDEQDIRDAAVFALSQRPDAESVPALMELAASAPAPATRRSALFWLAQSEDPRVPDFFARLLRAPGGR